MNELQQMLCLMWRRCFAFILGVACVLIAPGRRLDVPMAWAQQTRRAAPASDVAGQNHRAEKSREALADVYRVVEGWCTLLGNRLRLPVPATSLARAKVEHWLREWRREVLSLEEFQGQANIDQITLSKEEEDFLDLLRYTREHSILFDREIAPFSDRIDGFRVWLYQSPDFPLTMVPAAHRESWDKLDREPYERTLRRFGVWFENEIRQIPVTAQRESQLDSRITFILNELQTEIGERNQLCCGAIPTGANVSAKTAAYSKFIRLLHDTRQQLAMKGCLKADRLGKEKPLGLSDLERVIYA